MSPRRLARAVGPGRQPSGAQGLHDPVGAGGGQVVGGTGQRRRGPQQCAVRVGDELHVHSMAFVLPGVVRAVGSDPVDRQERCRPGSGTPCVGARTDRTSIASRM
ncbi:putative IS493-like transposase [Streptomyces sp. Tu6071]|nr:putative IS493-like transposase [Streptomyces sp. Tu6071]